MYFLQTLVVRLVLEPGETTVDWDNNVQQQEDVRRVKRFKVRPIQHPALST